MNDSHASPEPGTECQSGTPPKVKPRSKFRGIVVVERERCKGCGFCVEFCPTDALSLEPEFNRKGYHPPFVVEQQRCNGCNLCGLYCPDFAIFGVREKVQ